MTNAVCKHPLAAIAKFLDFIVQHFAAAPAHGASLELCQTRTKLRGKKIALITHVSGKKGTLRTFKIQNNPIAISLATHRLTELKLIQACKPRVFGERFHST